MMTPLIQMTTKASAIRLQHRVPLIFPFSVRPSKLGNKAKEMGNMIMSLKKVV